MPHGAVEEPKVKKLPAPSHYRPLRLSQSVRGRWHTPAAVSRLSKIDRIDHPRRATFASRNQLRSHIRNGNPLFSGCETLPTPATGAFTDAGRHALGPEHALP